jgi:hypothetical protein
MRTACAGTGTCGGTCDGTNRAACAYPGMTTSCGAPTCTDRVARTSACDGAGACGTGSSTPCVPYRCGATACNTTCATNNDCADGFVCRGSVCEMAPPDAGVVVDAGAAQDAGIDAGTKSPPSGARPAKAARKAAIVQRGLERKAAAAQRRKSEFGDRGGTRICARRSFAKRHHRNDERAFERHFGQCEAQCQGVTLKSQERKS